MNKLEAEARESGVEVDSEVMNFCHSIGIADIGQQIAIMRFNDQQRHSVLEREQRWVRVEDALPAEEGPYLCHTKTWSKDGEILCGEGDDVFYWMPGENDWSDGCGLGLMYCDVVAWTPIPPFDGTIQVEAEGATNTPEPLTKSNS